MTISAEASALTPLGQPFRRAARGAIIARAEALGLDGVLLLWPANVGYACGFHFSVNERPIGLYLPVKGTPTLFIPLLELENAADVEGVRLAVYNEYPGPVHPVVWMAVQSGASRIAIDTVEARILADLKSVLGDVVLEDLAAPSRFIKTDHELALTREASRFADMVLERLLANGANIASQGGTELDLMADCTDFARAALKAAHGTAFAGTKMGITASVHSGPRAALPHGSTSARKPQRGETLIAGIGASLGGYHAESGVTLIVGNEISPEQRRVMTAMKACNDAAVARLEPGARCLDVNDAAMAELAGAGLAKAIRHRIGHGMGVEGHEAPWLAPGDVTAVEAGMVFSNEPGVYRPGNDGYRTINTMIVHSGVVEIPSHFLADHPIDTRVLAL